MKLSTSQLLLAGMCAALPHYDSPRQRLLNGLDIPDKFLGKASKAANTNGRPYTRPWRNGLGASVLGPYNRDRSRQSPDMIRPPSTDHGNVANMRWSFTDSHTRIEVLPRQLDFLTS